MQTCDVGAQHTCVQIYPGRCGWQVDASLQLAEAGIHPPHAPFTIDLDFKNSVPLCSNETWLWSQSEAMHIPLAVASHD